MFHNLNGTSVPTETQVSYADVHALFLSLIVRASRRHALVALMPALDAAMRSADNNVKLARLNAVAAELEVSRE